MATTTDEQEQRRAVDAAMMAIDARMTIHRAGNDLLEALSAYLDVAILSDDDRTALITTVMNIAFPEEWARLLREKGGRSDGD